LDLPPLGKKLLSNLGKSAGFLFVDYIVKVCTDKEFALKKCLSLLEAQPRGYVLALSNFKFPFLMKLNGQLYLHTHGHTMLGQLFINAIKTKPKQCLTQAKLLRITTATKSVKHFSSSGKKFVKISTAVNNDIRN
jgi:hypothetical protein